MRGASQATLKRAASGASVPRRETVEGFVTACGADAKAVHGAAELWRWARIEERGRLGSLRAPRPELISDAGDLSKALERVWEQAGAPSLREIRRRSGDELALPVSSAARIVSRDAIPADLRQLTAFLTGCGVPEGNHAVWAEAWRKIASRRATVAAAAAALSRKPAEDPWFAAPTSPHSSPWFAAPTSPHSSYPPHDVHPAEKPAYPPSMVEADTPLLALRLAREAARNGLEVDFMYHNENGNVLIAQAKWNGTGTPPPAVASRPSGRPARRLRRRERQRSISSQ
ncbi:hypothetical protein [Streptomyces flavidovirens]